VGVERRRSTARLSDLTRGAGLAMTLTFAILGVIVGNWASRVPAVRATAHLNTLELGIALLGLAGGAVLAMPTVGWLVGRIGSRSMIYVGVACCCVALPLTTLGRSLGQLAALLLALGASIGTLDVAMNTYAVSLETRSERSMLSAFHAAFSIGGLLGAGGGAIAASLNIGPGLQFSVFAGASAITWATLVARRLSPEFGDVAAADLSSEVGRAEGSLSKRLIPLALIAFCGLLAEGAAADWSAVYLQTSTGASAAGGATGYAVFAVAMTISRLWGDRGHDRFGPVNVTRLGALVAAAGLASALAIGSPAAGIIGFGLLGAGLAPVIPIVFRASALSRSSRPGLGIATGTTVGYMGFMLGPPLIGATGRALGLPTALYIVVVANLVIALFAGSTKPDLLRAELEVSGLAKA
jgi:fucose permease